MWICQPWIYFAMINVANASLISSYLKHSAVFTSFIFYWVYSQFEDKVYCEIIQPIKDHRQITFISLNGFSPNGQYLAGWDINQNQIKNIRLFYILLQSLKVLLKKENKIRYSYQFFSCCFTSPPRTLPLPAPRDKKNLSS